LQTAIKSERQFSEEEITEIKCGFFIFLGYSGPVLRYVLFEGVVGHFVCVTVLMFFPIINLSVVSVNLVGHQHLTFIF